MLVYHSMNSIEYVGLRTVVGGRRQIVCGRSDGCRVVFDICSPSVPEVAIDEALKESIKARSVVCGVMSALNARNITVDVAC